MHTNFESWQGEASLAYSAVVQQSPMFVSLDTY